MVNIENAFLENIEAGEPGDLGDLVFHVSSREELALAIQAKYPKEQIIYNSGDLSLEVARMAVNYGIGRIIVYRIEELIMIESVCREKSQKMNALLHIPSADHDLIHEFIIKENTNFNLSFDLPQKTDFDFDFESPQNKDFQLESPQNTSLFPSVFRSMLCSQYVNLLGFHFHMDSQCSDKASCQNKAFALLGLLHNLKQTYGFNTSELSVGGFSFRI